MLGANHSVTVLGLGAMGSALASALLGREGQVMVWNRTPGCAGDLVDQGAVEVATVREAVSVDGPIVVCLYDHASVREQLVPVADALHGRRVINLTTTTPDEARERASWAEKQGIVYLDGAIMATPPLIGTSNAQILYSGSREAFDAHRELLDQWAVSSFEGDDPGLASLFDLAMLGGMYSMFAGFLQGAAMVQSAGYSAAGFAERATPFLAAMAELLGLTAGVVDNRDYSAPLQSLDWTVTVLETIGRASREQGIDPVPVDAVKALVHHQIDAGHGAEDFDRIIETLRQNRRPSR